MQMEHAEMGVADRAAHIDATRRSRASHQTNRIKVTGDARAFKVKPRRRWISAGHRCSITYQIARVLLLPRVLVSVEPRACHAQPSASVCFDCRGFGRRRIKVCGPIPQSRFGGSQLPHSTVCEQSEPLPRAAHRLIRQPPSACASRSSRHIALLVRFLAIAPSLRAIEMIDSAEFRAACKVATAFARAIR